MVGREITQAHEDLNVRDTIVPSQKTKLISLLNVSRGT